MKMIEDGNLTVLVRGLLIVIGVAIGAAGLAVEWLPKWMSILMILGGFAAMMIGGLSSRAALIGLRPFGESEWRKAKRTHESDEVKSKH